MRNTMTYKGYATSRISRRPILHETYRGDSGRFGSPCLYRKLGRSALVPRPAGYRRRELPVAHSLSGAEMRAVWKRQQVESGYSSIRPLHPQTVFPVTARQKPDEVGNSIADLATYEARYSPVDSSDGSGLYRRDLPAGERRARCRSPAADGNTNQDVGRGGRPAPALPSSVALFLRGSSPARRCSKQSRYHLIVLRTSPAPFPLTPARHFRDARQTMRGVPNRPPRSESKALGTVNHIPPTFVLARSWIHG